MFIKKKKKIPNTQTKIKPSKPLTHGRSRRRRRRRSELIVVIVVRLVAPHHRSEIGEWRMQIGVRCSLLGAPSDPSSRYFALFSLCLLLSLSLFNLYLSLSLGVLLLADRHRRRRHRLIALPLRLCLCSGERCSLPPPAVRPSLKVSL